MLAASGEPCCGVPWGAQPPYPDPLRWIGQNWPRYACLLVTGLEAPEAGMVSPETERVRRGLPIAAGE